MKSKSLIITVLLFTALMFSMTTLKVGALTTRDVAIIDVKPSTHRTYAGKIVAINVTVKNNGTDPDTFDVTAYFGNMTANYTISTLPTLQLAVGENVTLTFYWNTTGVQPCQNYTIKANCTLSEDPHQEDNEFVNGEVKVDIVADVNNDGKVDGMDIALIIKAFGSSPGHPRWDSYLDVNNDGKVDIKDIALALKKYGKTC